MKELKSSIGTHILNAYLAKIDKKIGNEIKIRNNGKNMNLENLDIHVNENTLQMLMFCIVESQLLILQLC